MAEERNGITATGVLPPGAGKARYGWIRRYSMQEVLRGLEPERVFWWFDRIAQIPHGSGREQVLSDYIKEYFQKLGFPVTQDRHWNLVIRKPATAGYEQAPAVILEAHLDMVCEKEADSGHDFDRDPIRILRDGDRLYADRTTLGADNATGVAFALSILESETAVHPALEVVLTTGEEAGLTGVKQLDFDSLKGRVVMNLDCSDEGIVVGCAGASVVRLELAGEFEPARREQQFYELRVAGLLGGHGGLHIGLGRGNANVILGRVLAAASRTGGFCLARVEGGTQNGAICREAKAVFAVEQGDMTAVEQTVAECTQELKHELAGVDPGMEIELEKIPRETAVLSQEDSAAYVSLINLLPSGVLEMERDGADRLPGVGVQPGQPSGPADLPGVPGADGGAPAGGALPRGQRVRHIQQTASRGGYRVHGDEDPPRPLAQGMGGHQCDSEGIPSAAGRVAGDEGV